MFNIGSTLDYAFGRERTSNSSTSSTRRNISQEGITKIMQDILASDQGLAALATGENLSGGSASTVKTQLAQDLVTKLAGELAVLNAETVTTQSSEGKKLTDQVSTGIKGGYSGTGTVICTELVRQGLLDKELYEAGTAHFQALPSRTITGYQIWAKKVVPHMQKSRKLSCCLVPIALARYNHITGRNRNFVGFLTVCVAQPVCYLIGLILEILHAYRLVEHA